ncbi:uncharacterized protein LOC117193677, partial [Drosophila miranda]|uniref:uncharacterized protein LOC117193677 n=1 Tax=Drosophila miranda TaxID=7229 RepID=UPI00143F4729
MSVSLQIEKLGEDNYDVWSMSMRSVLITTDLWTYVSGKTERPQEEAAGIREHLAQWDKADQKALACIILNVKATQLMHIKSCTTSKQAWQKLRHVHVSVGPVRKVQLYQKLLRQNMQNGDNVVQYVNSFVEITEKLAELNIDIQDELKVIMLLSSLPSGWENFVVAIETRDSLPSFETVKVKILEEGARKDERDDRELAVQAVYAHTQTQRNGARSKNYGASRKDGKRDCQKSNEHREFRGKCYKCKQSGHRASECKSNKDNTKECVR